MTDGRFRFDPELHEYFDLATGDIVAHITGLLVAAGEIDEQWFTKDSSERGSAVHKLTADFDLGALDVEGCVSRYRGYLLGHVETMKLVPHAWHNVEVARVSPVFRIGGRPDRDGLAWKAVTVWEVKSGGVEKSHQLQTALQAMVVADEYNLPPESIKRYAEYLTPHGRGKVLEHTKGADFIKARDIVRRFA